MTAPRIAAIILNWNNLTDTVACLDSLNQSHYPNLEIIVVDNDSRDGSAAVLAGMPGFHFIHNPRNLGFTGGNNVGMQAAFERGADYVLLLNNDATIAPDALGLLLETLESGAEVWASAPLIYYHSQPGVVWSAGGEIDKRRASARMMGTDEEDHGQFGVAPYPVDYATGCALLVKRRAVEEFGMLDDRFFMYYEEVEWCSRMAARGMQVRMVPQARAWHKIIPQARNESPFVHYLMTRNRLLWIRAAHLGGRVFWSVLLRENLRTLISWSLRPRWRHKRQQRQAMWQAIRDVFRGRYGPPQLQSRPARHEILLEENSS